MKTIRSLKLWQYWDELFSLYRKFVKDYSKQKALKMPEHIARTAFRAGNVKRR